MVKINLGKIEAIAKLIRYWILTSTTQAGSGHPTSSLSAVELMTGLLFSGIFRFDVNNPSHPNNDRLIFSKGHASPLFYSLWAATGAIKEQELMMLRKFNSSLEGHPTTGFPYAEAATGSLGQGLSIGLGLALNAKYLDRLPYQTYVLLGDSEMSEGSIWEAIQLAAYYKLDNLVGIIDVNRLGQRGQTMFGYNLKNYQDKISSFGWHPIVIDGHDLKEIIKAYQKALKIKNKPVMIIAKTIKGKGVSFLENKNGWHGRILKPKELKQSLKELGDLDTDIRASIDLPQNLNPKKEKVRVIGKIKYSKKELVATRKSYGQALIRIFPKFPKIVSLDAEVSNSTYAQIFKNKYPKHFFEMFIAEQNMVGVALGLASRGKIPFVSTFAAFLTRAHDQIRMIQYSPRIANVKFIGSHAGVSIGQDGPSQMGLEDIAMFRSILDSVVLYPADAVSTERLVEAAAKHQGIVYIRTTRADTPVIYNQSETFSIGGSKILKQNQKDIVTVIGAGITLYQALAAHEELKKQGIFIRIVDLYSIKPIDRETLKKAARETKFILTVEDHFAEGGIGEAVKDALADVPSLVYSLAVKKMPKSGQLEELLDFEEISQAAIIKKIKELI